MHCNDANAIPTRLRFADTYAATIAGRYRLEGLGMGCKWLAGYSVYMDWMGWEIWGWVVNGYQG